MKDINNIKLYNNTFDSLLIIMNEVIKKLWLSSFNFYKIIEKPSNYIILNEKLSKLLLINKCYYNLEEIIFIKKISMYQFLNIFNLYVGKK